MLSDCLLKDIKRQLQAEGNIQSEREHSKRKGTTDEYVAGDSEALETVRTLLIERRDTKPFIFTNRRGSRYTRKGIALIVRAVRRGQDSTSMLLLTY